MPSRTRADVVYELAANASYLECDRQVLVAELLLFFAHFGMRVPQVAAILREEKITTHPDGSETISRETFAAAFAPFYVYVFAQLIDLYRNARLSTRYTLNELLVRHDRADYTRRANACPFSPGAAAAPGEADEALSHLRVAALGAGKAPSAIWTSKRSLLSAPQRSTSRSTGGAPSFISHQAALRVTDVQIRMDTWASDRHLEQAQARVKTPS